MKLNSRQCFQCAGQTGRSVLLENGNWAGTLCLCALISSRCTADCIFAHPFRLSSRLPSKRKVPRDDPSFSLQAAVLSNKTALVGCLLTCFGYFGVLIHPQPFFENLELDL